jgi:hypothetical protein
VAPKEVEGRKRKRVVGIFEELRAKTKDPQEHQWIGEAEGIAGKLVGVVPIDKAAQAGLEHFTNRVNEAGKLAMVEANRKPRWGGGGGVAKTGDGWVTGKQGTVMNQFSAEMDDTVRITMDKYKIPALNTADQQVRAAKAGLARADNPASQRLAIRQIIKAMSGLVVTNAEGRIYEQASGLIDQLENAFAQLSGGAMSPGYIQSIMGVVDQWIGLADATRAQAANDGAEFFASKVNGRAPDDVIQEAAGGVYNMVVGGGSAPRVKTSSSRNVPKPEPAAGGDPADPAEGLY